MRLLQLDLHDCLQLSCFWLSNSNINDQARMRDHCNQDIDTKQMQLPPDEIADARLCHTKPLSRFSLSDFLFLNILLDLGHQLGSDQQVF